MVRWGEDQARKRGSRFDLFLCSFFLYVRTTSLLAQARLQAHPYGPQVSMRPGRRSNTMREASLQQRLACFPLVLFGSYTLLRAYQDYFDNDGKQDLDVVELWSGVESIVFAARAPGHRGHHGGHEGQQPLRAEGFDKHRSPGITDQEGPGCEDITCVDGFRHALQLVSRLRRGGLLWMAPTCSSFSFANSCRCKRKAGSAEGDTSYKNVATGNLEAQVAAFLFALAAALGIYAVIEKPIASQLFSYVQPFLVSQVPTSYINTYRCAWDVDTPEGQRMLKGYKFLAAASSTWVQKLQRKCSCPGGIRGGNHIPLMIVGDDGGTSGNKAALRQSQAYPRELGKAIISAWLTTRVAHEGCLEGHEGLQAAQADSELDVVASVSLTIHSMGDDFDSAWGASSSSANATPNWEGWD